MDFRLSLLLVALGCSSIASAADSKVKVTIYFESLCPDSQKFFNEQFSKGYKALKEHISPDFVPYGHVNSTGACQHGPAECEGNVFLDCAVKKLENDTDTLVKVVDCIMNGNAIGDHFNFSACVNTTEHYNEIFNCSTSPEGASYFKEFGTLTNQAFQNFTNFDVPVVVLNDRLDFNESLALRTDFLKTLCSHALNDTNVAACKSSASGLVASLISTLIAVVLARL